MTSPKGGQKEIFRVLADATSIVFSISRRKDQRAQERAHAGQEYTISLIGHDNQT